MRDMPRRAATAKWAASTPMQKRPVSRPAQPGTGTPYSGTRSPSTMAPPPLLSTDQVPDAAGYFITHPAHPVVQGAKRAALTTSTPMQWPMSQQTLGSLTRRPPSRPPHHPFWHAQHAFHVRQGEQPTGGQSSRGLAAWPGTGTPYSGARSASTPAPPPPLILKAAAHQMGAATSQSTRAHPLGGSRADSLRYSPSTPDPRFAHAEVSSPQKGHSNVTAALPWTGAPYRGARPPPSRAGTPQRHTAAWRHGGLVAPRHTHSSNYHIPFKHQGAIATMCERRNHHHA